jgi:hypothetical protein
VVKGRVLLAVAIGLVLALAACSAIIGTRDLTLEPSDADSGAVGDSARPAPDAGSDASCATESLQSDPSNCGACGHDCLGGLCATGQCQPVALVPGQQGPFGLTLTADTVYWSNYEGDQIMSALKDGGGLTIVAQDSVGVSSPIDVVTDDTYVYWYDDEDNTTDPGDVGRIARCPLAGCGTGVSTVIVTNIDEPAALRVAGNSLYWADWYGGFVASANKADGSHEVIYATGEVEVINDVNVDSSFIYWSTNDDIRRAALDAGGPDGGPFTLLYAPAGGMIVPNKIALDDAGLYYPEFNDPGFVQSIPKTGVGSGAPLTYASALHYPVHVALDANNLYWVNQGPNSGDSQNFIFTDGSIMTCPKAGCPPAGPTVLATGQGWPRHVEVDDTAIYWTDHGNNTNDGVIMKLAK